MRAEKVVDNYSLLIIHCNYFNKKYFIINQKFDISL